MSGSTAQSPVDAASAGNDEAARAWRGAQCTYLEFGMLRDQARTRAHREADKVFKTFVPETPMTDYAKAQMSFHENRERLKAQRLAREARPKPHVQALQAPFVSKPNAR